MEGLSHYGFRNSKVSENYIYKVDAKTIETVRQDLIKNEGNSRNFIIANFAQNAFTDDSDIGHMATVGAYDDKSRKVLILDPDRKYYEPYWVSVETLIRGMNTTDSDGVSRRGYLFISLE